MVILMILILLLVIGMFMDINAALIILAPVLGPLTQTIGMDPVHAGVMIVLALNIALMTPPVGACLFVICSITGIRLEALSKAIWPFILIEVAVLFLIAFLAANDHVHAAPASRKVGRLWKALEHSTLRRTS